MAGEAWDLLVQGGSLVDEAGIRPLDLGVRGGRIVAAAPGLGGSAGRRVDATGMLVLPGGIDPHVHLGLPAHGTVSCDDVAAGTRSALCGGVTTVIDFTLQAPGEALADSLRRRRSAFDGVTYADYALHANLTDFPPGEDEGVFESRLANDFLALRAAGGGSVKIFTCYDGMAIPRDRLAPVLRAAVATGVTVLVHAEDPDLLGQRMVELRAAERLGPADYPESRPAEAEARAVTDVIAAGEAAGCPLYFVHVSTGAAVDAIRAGRTRARIPIRYETCPQYLVLDRAAYDRADGARFIVAPPLRSARDRESLRQALGRHEVDVVATDHCPYRAEQRDGPGVPFPELPSGLPGVETRLPLLFTYGPAVGRLGVPELAKLTAATPARIFGLWPRKGHLGVGADADLVILDPERRWTIRARTLHGNCDLSPYEGTAVQGRVRDVFLRGTCVVEEGEPVAGSEAAAPTTESPAPGEFLSR